MLATALGSRRLRRLARGLLWFPEGSRRLGGRRARRGVWGGSMRRFAVCGFVALAVGLVLAPGALASTGARHAVPLGTRHEAMTRPKAAPLAAGPYAITGHALDFAGNLVNGAR